MNARNALEVEPHGYAGEPAWDEVVGRIQAGEASGMEELYRVFSNGIRFYLYRRFGSQDLDDKVHDIFLIVALAIRAGEVREPERLMGYVRTVVRRQVASYIESAMHARLRHSGLDKVVRLSDRRPDPERRAIERQNMKLAMRILNSVRKRDREVLIRFYLKEQSAPDICREMDLSVTQFRLIKTRAKTRFGELGRSRLGLATVIHRA
jgi:RNA polymerase sigma factor (sigma-70 family)